VVFILLLVKMNFSYIGLPKNLKKKVFFRAGIIPYTVVENEKYFCLGRDRKSKDLTDFGGGNEPGDKDHLDTAIREFIEESLHIFQPPTRDDLEKSVCVCFKTMIIFFVKVNCCPLISKKKFAEKSPVNNNNEMSEIVWLPEKNMLRLFEDPYNFIRVYSRVREVISDKIPKVVEMLV
jgi:hypothetical protein